MTLPPACFALDEALLRGSGQRLRELVPSSMRRDAREAKLPPGCHYPGGELKYSAHLLTLDIRGSVGIGGASRRHIATRRGLDVRALTPPRSFAGSERERGGRAEK